MSRRILILSGPTHEYIDPVRFIGNISSGLMGKAIAEEAIRLQYEVQFVTGPVAAPHLPDLGNAGSIHPVISAAEMLQAAAGLFQSADVIIFAAAVADYTPVEKKTEKMAKSSDDLILKLKATADIAKTLCADKTPDQIAIGFALQTSEGEANARRKLESKKLDGIVLNTPATLGAQTGTFSFLALEKGQFEHWGCIGKSACASRIFQALELL
ncbi:phosphopantothenoylcysteine decarboxylase [Pontiellaceae bacterium B1224]|nr:phosphopantothenoylcysteine decarboxylase [Pontiellaceae bacterium B1224]